MSFIDKLKEWWNKPSWENQLCKDYNDVIMEFARDLEKQREAKRSKRRKVKIL